MKKYFEKSENCDTHPKNYFLVQPDGFQTFRTFILESQFSTSNKELTSKKEFKLFFDVSEFKLFFDVSQLFFDGFKTHLFKWK